MDKTIAAYYHPNCKPKYGLSIYQWNPANLKENQYAINSNGDKVTRQSTIEEVQRFISRAEMTIHVIEKDERKVVEFTEFYKAVELACQTKDPMVRFKHCEWTENFSQFEKEYIQECILSHKNESPRPTIEVSYMK